MSSTKNPCAEPGCPWSIGNNHKFAMIRAHSRGWYIQKNGKQWCPEHRPKFAPILPNDHEARRTYICNGCAKRKIIEIGKRPPSYFRCVSDWCTGRMIRQKVRK